MIVLASCSPRRLALLSQVGIAVRQVVPSVDETPKLGESPDTLVTRLAADKAHAVAKQLDADAVVLAADTVVVHRNTGENWSILGKPEGEQSNRDMLRSLQGGRHAVLTGFCVRHQTREHAAWVKTEVVFRDLRDQEIAAYAASGEGADKAGGYAIQGRAAAFISRIEGSYSNVVGLPLCEVIEALRAIGGISWP